MNIQDLIKATLIDATNDMLVKNGQPPLRLDLHEQERLELAKLEASEIWADYREQTQKW